MNGEGGGVEIETSEGAGDCAKTAAAEVNNAMDNGSLIKSLDRRKLPRCNRRADLTLARCEGYGVVSNSAERRAVPFRDVVFGFGHRMWSQMEPLPSKRSAPGEKHNHCVVFLFAKRAQRAGRRMISLRWNYAGESFVISTHASGVSVFWELTAGNVGPVQSGCGDHDRACFHGRRVRVSRGRIAVYGRLASSGVGICGTSADDSDLRPGVA
jgi:hypothetical protein